MVAPRGRGRQTDPRVAKPKPSPEGTRLARALISSMMAPRDKSGDVRLKSDQGIVITNSTVSGVTIRQEQSGDGNVQVVTVSGNNRHVVQKQTGNGNVMSTTSISKHEGASESDDKDLLSFGHYDKRKAKKALKKAKKNKPVLLTPGQRFVQESWRSTLNKYWDVVHTLLFIPWLTALFTVILVGGIQGWDTAWLGFALVFGTVVGLVHLNLFLINRGFDTWSQDTIALIDQNYLADESAPEIGQLTVVSKED